MIGDEKNKKKMRLTMSVCDLIDDLQAGLKYINQNNIYNT